MLPLGGAPGGDPPGAGGALPARVRSFLEAPSDADVCWVPCETALEYLRGEAARSPGLRLPLAALLQTVRAHAAQNLRPNSMGAGSANTTGLVSVDFLLDAAARYLRECEARGAGGAPLYVDPASLSEDQREVPPDARRLEVSPAPLPPRTDRTRRVPHPVLIGHAASLTPY